MSAIYFSLPFLLFLGHLLLNNLRLLLSCEPGLRGVDVGLSGIQLGHHLQDSLFLAHHLLDYRIEQLVRVLGHL